MPQKNKKTTQSKTLIPQTKIIYLNIKPYLPLNPPPIISIDPGPTNSALISTQPPIALQFINDTNSQSLSSTLKNLLHTHTYSLILIENFHLYSPRKHATDCLISIGYLTAITNLYNTPHLLINKPRKNYSPTQLPHKLQHIQDALNLLYYFLSTHKT
jgi:hypothetical protein